MTPESRPGVIDHPDVRRGLHKPQVDKPKKHINWIKPVAFGLTPLIAAGGIYLAVRFGSDNGGENVIIPSVTSDTQEPSSTPTPTTTETVKPTVTPTITPTTEATTTPEPTKDAEKERILALMPDVAGFQKVIKDVNGVQKNVYVAIKGNEYGLEAGVDAGYFKEEVTFEGEQVGGIAFDAKVVLAKQGDLVVVPVDISEINDKTSVDLTLSDITNGLGTKYENCFLTINTNGKKVSVSNIITDFEINNKVTIPSGIFPDYFKTAFSPVGVDGKDYYPTISGDFDISTKFQMKALFGQKLIETDNPIGLIYIKAPDAKTLEYKDFLEEGNCIVFLEDID